jgi:PAS domain S-box-containing protein
VYYNDGASRILGYKTDEILGANVVTLYPSLAEAKRVMKAMRGDGHGGRGIVETFQTTFRSKSSADIPVAISGTRALRRAGNEDGTIGFAKDLREILRKDQLATLGEVAVGLSHEINNPLGVIVNQIEAARARPVRRSPTRATCRSSASGSMRCGARWADLGRVSRGSASRPRARPTRRSTTSAGAAHDRPAREAHGGGRAAPHRGARAGRRRRSRHLSEREGDPRDGRLSGLHGARRRGGLRCVDSTPLDIVLSDVVMPEMDGYELYTTIRKTHPGLPVLMMTGFHYDREHVIKRSRLEGLEGVIFKKPVDPTG